MATNAPIITWTFGGPLADQPPVTAWSVLASAAVLGVVFVWWSYHRSLVEITLGRRAILWLLRILPWLGLLVVLAAPTRVRQIYEQPHGARPLAVLVDQSGSMTTPDNRHRRRLDDALRRWRETQPAARTAYSEMKTFAFADDIQPAPLGASAAKVGSEQTRLFAALQHVLAEAPAGGWASVVTLTDGLDTSGTAVAEGVEMTVRAALGQSTTLFFVPGRNRYTGAPFFGLRDFNVPAEIPPRSKFRAEATFDSFQATARTVDVQFSINGVARPSTTLRVEAGRRLTTWSTEIEAVDLNAIEVELHAGDEIARATVRIKRPSSNRILYYQGALDWSYRFLADILKERPSFVLTPVFNLPRSDAALPPGALRRLPEIPDELDGFDIVILANAAASQFTRAQQEALGTWVRNGGVVLFFTPDDDSSQGFVGSELEKMLPVSFAPPQGRSSRSTNRLLAALGGRSGAADSTKLVAFAWEKSSRVREIFADSETDRAALASPLFSEYAHVALAKPGADVLARHPTDLAPDGSERAILLAVQRYGRGQSAVLTTDALWRWKMNQPADDPSAGTFWQTLLAWLTREQESGLRFEAAPWVAEIDREISLRVAGATGNALKVEVASGAKRIVLDETSGGGGSHAFPWRPPNEGLWEVTATDAAGFEATHWIAVKKPIAPGELSGAAPDEELLRDLATRTGGAILEQTSPTAWQQAPSETTALLSEQREPLWHRPWIFATILGLYCAEMILRRRWRML